MRLRRSCLLAALFTLLILTLPLAAQPPVTSTSTAAMCAAQPPATSTSTAATCDACGSTFDCCACFCQIECEGRYLCTLGCTLVCGSGGTE